MSSIQAVTAAAPRQVPTAGMIWIPPADGGASKGFWLDTRPVTVAEFRRFVRQTGYRTVAEDAGAAGRAPGSLVRAGAGWHYLAGASWRHPEGPGSSISRRDKYPVTHVAYDDAVAYADWAGKDLPTEAEWEYAAHGGLPAATSGLPDDPPDHQARQSHGPGGQDWRTVLLDGQPATAPVACLPANGYGLYDMAGNVWQWTADQFPAEQAAPDDPAGCVPASDPAWGTAGQTATARVIKGGSRRCVPGGCQHEQPASRQRAAARATASHLGFRCVFRPPG